jgi:hypothetical protein
VTRALATIPAAIRPRLGRWLLIAIGTMAVYYAALLAVLIVRFENWPNYMVGYDWPGNITRIVRSTPSLADIVMIAQGEWLLEVGYMNMSFGRGISEWSLTLVPAKMAAILLLGALIATVWALDAERRRSCDVRADGAAIAASSLGISCIALTGATMTWVVCCATPSWIVGLAMLGLGVATANAIEPAGPYIGATGFALLALAIARLASSHRVVRPSSSMRQPGGVAFTGSDPIAQSEAG